MNESKPKNLMIEELNQLVKTNRAEILKIVQDYIKKEQEREAKRLESQLKERDGRISTLEKQMRDLQNKNSRLKTKVFNLESRLETTINTFARKK
jgi:septal ring factor EnvC (AmiA/AmiB activator)